MCPRNIIYYPYTLIQNRNIALNKRTSKYYTQTKHDFKFSNNPFIKIHKYIHYTKPNNNILCSVVNVFQYLSIKFNSKKETIITL